MTRVGSRFKKIFEEAQQHPAYWMEDLRLQFLEGISAIMETQGLTQKELAEKMGVSEAYISKVFNDDLENNFTLKTLVELGRAVNAKIKINVIPQKSEKAEQLTAQQSFSRFKDDENDVWEEAPSQKTYSQEDKSLEPVAA